MKLLSILFLFASLFLIDTDSISYGRYISIKDAPYFISLLDPRTDDNVYACGGTIISEYWVVTAAHCVNNHARIIAGESLYNKQNSPSVYYIEKIFVHGRYPGSALIYDAALIKLKEPIIFDEYQQPIKIRKNPPRINETVVVTGFGDQGDQKGYPPVLRQTVVTVVNFILYQTWGEEYSTFAAGNATTAACSGDSGGPAVIDGQLAGIVSGGTYCKSYDSMEKIPEVYARVDAIYDWILKITGIVY